MEAGWFYADVSGPVRAREDRPNRWQEVVRHGAADAAVGQFPHVLLVAALDAAAIHDLRVDAEIAELVDDERDPPPAGIAQQVADGAGLAGAEEAGDDRRGDLAGSCSGHVQSLAADLRVSGRPAATNTTSSATAARS